MWVDQNITYIAAATAAAAAEINRFRKYGSPADAPRPTPPTPLIVLEYIV